MRGALFVLHAAVLAATISAGPVDDRPEVWMFTANGNWCPPCNAGKKCLKACDKSLPFKVVIKHGLPEWLPDASYPTFYWGVQDTSGAIEYKKLVGWTGKNNLVDAWQKSRETAVERAYRNAELKIGHAAAQRQWRSISEKDGVLPRSIIDPSDEPAGNPAKPINLAVDLVPTTASGLSQDRQVK